MAVRHDKGQARKRRVHVWRYVCTFSSTLAVMTLGSFPMHRQYEKAHRQLFLPAYPFLQATAGQLLFIELQLDTVTQAWL